MKRNWFSFLVITGCGVFLILVALIPSRDQRWIGFAAGVLVAAWGLAALILTRKDKP